jgi:type I restriction enzyme, S subunit
VIYVTSPKGWHRTRLRFCIEGSQNGVWGSEPGTDEIDVACVRVADFDWEHISVKLRDPTIRSIPKAQFTRLRLQSGDILLEKSGGGETTPVGRIVYFNQDLEAVCSNFVARIRPRGDHDDRFLAYLMAALYLSGYSHQFIKQNTGIQNLDGDALFDTPVWVPAPDTQKAIAAFLDVETARIDDLIEKKRDFLALIEEKRACLIERAVNGSILSQRDQAGTKGWFGHLPSSWAVKRGRFLFRERQQRSLDGSEELLTVSHITGVTTRAAKDVNMFLAESLEGYKVVQVGDVVVNTMWAWMGAMGVSDLEGIVSPSYGVYGPTSDEFDRGFLDLLLRSKPFVAEVNRRSKGIWASRLRLYPDAFLDIVFPIPPQAAQNAILFKLSEATATEEQIAARSRNSIDRLRELRSALITAAVTGQIDIISWGRRGVIHRRLDAIQESYA